MRRAAGDGYHGCLSGEGNGRGYNVVADVRGDRASTPNKRAAK